MQTAKQLSNNQDKALLFSIESAASAIGISTATVRNWIKAGHLTPVNERPVEFLQSDVLSLKDAIVAGKFDRLRKRANKTNSSVTLIPKEYASHASLIETAYHVAAISTRNQLDPSTVMFFVVMRVLVLKGEAKLLPSKPIGNFGSFGGWRRDNVKKDMEDWFRALRSVSAHQAYGDIYNAIHRADEEDFIGLIYQCLAKEGEKSSKGSYYTPTAIINDALKANCHEVKTFLDPCCGTGNYIIRAAEILNLCPESIFGFDIDPTAVRLARVNFLLTFPQFNGQPNIRCLDSLCELANGDLLCDTNAIKGSIDLIATNPPWGAYKNLEKVRFVEVGTSEVFALFLAKSLQLLRDGGKLSFILPEAFLKIKTHAEIRSFVLRTSTVNRVIDLGRAFTGVFTPAIRLDVTKGTARPGSRVSIRSNGQEYHIEQSRFSNNDNFVFDASVSDAEGGLLEKLYQVPHITLKGGAKWALGIVTGNNSKYVLSTSVSGAEPVARGSDVMRYRLSRPATYIKYDRVNFQQVAKDEFYRAPEKLIYKFISNALVFAYDDKQTLTLNSANILIPELSTHSIKVVMAFLNSSVFHYIFKKKFATHKVLRGDIESIPFPILTQAQHAKIEALADAAILGEQTGREIDAEVCSSFALSPEEIKIVQEVI